MLFLCCVITTFFYLEGRRLVPLFNLLFYKSSSSMQRNTFDFGTKILATFCDNTLNIMLFSNVFFGVLGT